MQEPEGLTTFFIIFSLFFRLLCVQVSWLDTHSFVRPFGEFFFFLLQIFYCKSCIFIWFCFVCSVLRWSHMRLFSEAQSSLQKELIAIEQHWSLPWRLARSQFKTHSNTCKNYLSSLPFQNILVFYVYLFTYFCVRSSLLHGFFSSCGKQGLLFLFLVVCRLLIAVASLVEEHRL